MVSRDDLLVLYTSIICNNDTLVLWKWTKNPKYEVSIDIHFIRIRGTKHASTDTITIYLSRLPRLLKSKRQY